MKTLKIQLRKWNLDTCNYDDIDCSSLSQAMLLLDESNLYELIISDEVSTGELIISIPGGSFDVVSYNY